MVILVIGVCLFFIGYLGDVAHWFDFVLHGIELGYAPQLVRGTQAFVLMAFLLGFIVRNDIEHFRGRGGDHH
jgi:hypothetical protein